MMTPKDVETVVMMSEPIERKFFALFRRMCDQALRRMDGVEEPMSDMMGIQAAAEEFDIPITTINESIVGGWVDGGKGWVSRKGMEELRDRRIERFGLAALSTAPADIDEPEIPPLPADAITHQEAAILIGRTKFQIIGKQNAGVLSKISGHSGYVLKGEVEDMGVSILEEEAREQRRIANKRPRGQRKTTAPIPMEQLPPAAQ